MSIRRLAFGVVVASLVVLAVGSGPPVAGTVRALPPAQEPLPQRLTVAYPGRLADESGRPVADGAYDFAFALYETQTGGEPLWSEVQEAVEVQGGAFVASLGSREPVAGVLSAGQEGWLEVGVRGPGEAAFTVLRPRQRLRAAASDASALSQIQAPSSPTANGACPHDHWGAVWSGNQDTTGLSVINSGGVGLRGVNGEGWASANGPAGVIGVSSKAAVPMISTFTYLTGVFGYGEEMGVIGSGGTTGVEGWSTSGTGIRGTSQSLFGVVGNSSSNIGVFGTSIDASVTIASGRHGVYGVGEETGVTAYGIGSHGVYGETQGDWGWISGVYGKAHKDNANGVTGESTGAGVGVYGRSASGLAGKFAGPVEVTGWLTKPAGSFKIDHPLDPENKYLSHSFVEAPEMMNVYNGNVVLDGEGEAWVELPDWFEALNRDYRYQLTCIGGFAPVYIAQEIEDNRFQIAGGTPGLKVSWQVTGVRHDAFAEAHPLKVEEDKPPEEQGTYLHPVEHGVSVSLGLDTVQYQQPAGP
jgi:hypothetical protein